MNPCELPCGCKLGCKGEGNTTRVYVARAEFCKEDWHDATMEFIWIIRDVYKAKQPALFVEAPPLV